MTRAVLHCDGAARPGNPGPAGAGYVVWCGDRVEEHADALGVQTNNVAEYEAVLRGLRTAVEMGARYAHVRTDSLLVVSQLRKEDRWKCNDERLRYLRDKILELARCFHGGVEYQWIPREQNIRADALSRVGAAESLRLQELHDRHATREDYT